MAPSASNFARDLDEDLALRAIALNESDLGMMVLGAYRIGLTSAEVRNAVESAIAASLTLDPGEFPRAAEDYSRRFDQVRAALERQRQLGSGREDGHGDERL